METPRGGGPSGSKHSCSDPPSSKRMVLRVVYAREVACDRRGPRSKSIDASRCPISILQSRLSGSRPRHSVPARRCLSPIPKALLLDNVRPVCSQDGFCLQEFQDLLSHRSRNRRKQAYPQQGLAQEPQHKIAESLDDHSRDPTNRSQRLSRVVTDVPLPFLVI